MWSALSTDCRQGLQRIPPISTLSSVADQPEAFARCRLFSTHQPLECATEEVALAGPVDQRSVAEAEAVESNGDDLSLPHDGASSDRRAIGGRRPQRCVSSQSGRVEFQA